MTISRNLSKVGAKVDLNGVVVPVANSVTRDMLSPTTGGTSARNWTLLGASTPLAANAPRTPTISWSGQFQQLMLEYYIAGYQGSAVGRILFGTNAGGGTTALTETGTGNCYSNIIEDAGVATKTGLILGVPTASGVIIAINAAERFGIMNINNQLAKNKRITGQGQYSLANATSAPFSVKHDAIYMNTAAQIQQVAMVSYNDISTQTVVGNNLTTGSYVIVWGRNND